MKTMKKIVLLVLSLTLVMTVFVACGGDKKDLTGAAAAEINGSYLSPTSVTYHNMRPENNYYLTTVSYQQLTTYKDGTYCLSEMSTTHSAIVITAEDLFGSDEGVEFTGIKSNPRNSYIKMFFGTFTQNSNDITLKKPFRIMNAVADGNGAALYYSDTAAWTSNMNDNTNFTLNDYFKNNAFNDITVSVGSSTNVFETISTAISAEQASNNEVPTVPAMQDKPTSPAYAKVKGIYLGKIPAIVHTPLSGNDFTIGFNIQMLIAYDDGCYNFTHSTANIKNLKLATAASTWTGTMDTSTLINYYGKYNSTVDDFDDQTLHMALTKPSRIVSHNKTADAASAYYLDTYNWTDSMGDKSEATEKTASAYLALKAFNDTSIAVTTSNFGFASATLTVS